MKDYQKIIKVGIDHAADGGKLILLQRCQGKYMKEIHIQELINVNYRLCTLLGIATEIVMDYRKLQAYHDNSEKCKWFFDAVQAIIYENKPLPPMP